MSTINQTNEKKSSAEIADQEEVTMMEVDGLPEMAERAEMIKRAEMFERAERAGCKISGGFIPLDESDEDSEENFAMISKMSTINQNNEKKSSAENSKQEEETMMEVDVQPEKAETVEAAARGERAEMIEKAEMFERAERAGCKISGSFLPVDESGEDNEEGFDIDKILDYYIREPGSPARAVPPVVTNTSASAGAACAEKAADVAYTAHGAATSCSSGTDVETNLKKIFNNITDESMVSDENKSALMQSAQEQLFIDWCTSRQIMTKKDGDE